MTDILDAMYTSALHQLCRDIAAGRHISPDLMTVVADRIDAAELEALAEVACDPLAFVPLLRASLGTPAELKMRVLAQEQLDRLGLGILRPDDVINTTPQHRLAAADVFG